MAESDFDKLLEFLNSKSGDVGDSETLVALLASCWGMIDGSTTTQMDGGKLDRMENSKWNPPILTFVVERHGSLSQGSTRAEVQGWTVDLQQRTATSHLVRRRQIEPMAPRLRTRPIAQELAAVIVGGQEDHRIKRYPNGSVRLLIGEVIPNDGYRDTVAGRRKKLKAHLREALDQHGWTAEGTNRFRPPDTASSQA